MNRIESHIKDACSEYKDGLHYPDYFEVLGALSKIMSYDDLEEHEDLLTEFISPHSATMAEKTVLSIIDKMRETYPKQGLVSNAEYFESILDCFEDSDPIIEKYLSRIMDQEKDYPDPEAILNIIQNGVTIPFLTLEGISLWQGKQKSKKTTLLAMAVSEYISGRESFLPVRFERKIPGKVLFFDCEQGTAYAARTMKLILKLAGVKKSDNLRYIDLRKDPPYDRRELIETALSYEKDVRWIIIDGVVDLMNDFMDPKEAQPLVAWISRLASNFNLHVTGVLHQNKGDQNARAHIGSILSQKCEIEISATVNTKKPEESQITCVNNRGLRFKPFSIVWEVEQLPKICQSKIDVTQDLRNLATQVFGTDLLLGRGEIHKKLMEILKGDKNVAEKKLVEMIGVVIEKTGSEHRAKYRIGNDQIFLPD
jgi:hypothetical protein